MILKIISAVSETTSYAPITSRPIQSFPNTSPQAQKSKSPKKTPHNRFENVAAGGENGIGWGNAQGLPGGRSRRNFGAGH